MSQAWAASRICSGAAQHHGVAEKRQLGTVAPDDAFAFQLAVPLARLAELAHDPQTLFAHGRVDFAQRHPFGRADHEAVGADHEADGAALAALEFESHGSARQPDLAVGTGVLETRGRERQAGRSVRCVPFRRVAEFTWRTQLRQGLERRGLFHGLAQRL
jgi:hypothetical protein